MTLPAARSGKPAPARGRCFKFALLVGTALGGTVFASPPALANDECGAPVAGQVICTAAGNPYLQGIAYSSQTALGVALQAGVQVNTQNPGATGVRVHSDTDARLVSAGPVQTSGDHAFGVYVTSFGDASVTASGAVSATGDFADAVSVGAEGAANVVVHDVNVEGENGHGVMAHGASVSIASTGTVSSLARTSGVLAGVAAYALGDATVSVNNVSTAGDNVDGIHIETEIDWNAFAPTPGAPGDAYVTVNGVVSTQGDNADGVDVLSQGVVSFTNNGLITTSGVESYGARLTGDQGVVLAGGGEIFTSGDDAIGLVADSTSGSITGDIGSVRTEGEYSDAVWLRGREIDVAVSRVETLQQQSHGVLADGDNITLEIADVTTSGDYSQGVAATGDTIAIDVDRVFTEGVRALGVQAMASGDLRITSSDRIATTGEASDAVVATAATGTVVLDLVDVSTSGAGAQAIFVYASDADVRATGAISTTGGPQTAGYPALAAVRVSTTTGDARVEVNDVHAASLQGVNVQTPFGDASVIVNGTVSTEADASAAIVVDAAERASVTNNGDIVTAGLGSYGIHVIGDEVMVDSIGTISTSGDYADGVAATGNSLALHVDSITTQRAYADGVSAFSGGDLVLSGSGLISTSGEETYAVQASAFGNADIDLTDVSTSGAGSTAVRVDAQDADVRISGAVTSTGVAGQARAAIHVSTTGDARVEVNDVRTESLAGLFTETLGDATVVVNGEVSTTADDAPAVTAEANGHVSITNNGSVVTLGENSVGIQGYGNQGVTIDGAGAVQTFGETAFGIVAASFGGAVSIAAGPVTTLGTDAYGIVAYGRDGVSIAAGGAVVTSGIRASGISVDSTAGPVTVGYTSIETSGNEATGIYAAAYGPGDVAVTGAGAIATHGDNAIGLYADSRQGGTHVSTGAVSTAGFAAHAIQAEGATGLSVSANGPISTLGDGATGILAFSSQGPATVNYAGSISTSGAGSGAVIASAEGPVTISGAGVISTTGDDAGGVFAQSYSGPVSVTSGAISTSGDRSFGIRAEGAGGLSVQSNGPLGTTGDFAGAILASSLAGPVSINYAGAVSTTGEGSRGIEVFANGDVAVTGVGTVTTSGASADGIAVSSSGATSITAGALTTTGEGAAAIVVEGEQGATVVVSGPVSTTGDQSDGIAAGSLAGAVSIAAGEVATSGDNAIGILGFGGGSVSISAGDISTSGDAAYGVLAAAANQVSVQVSGEVATTGTNAYGVYANGDQVDVAWQTIVTSGDGGYGLAALGDGDVAVSGGSVATHGVEAHGIQAYSENGDVTVNATAVSSLGAISRGIMAEGAGAVQVSAGTVSAADVAILAISSTGSAGIAVDGGATSLTADALQVSGATTADLVIGADAVIAGAVNSVRMISGDGSTLVNNGVINTIGGYGIQIDGGAATILNAGGLGGRIDLTDADDLFTNSGLFLAAGESLFGAGDDAFVNSGVLRSAFGATLSGLETFHNAGLIDLTNGAAGTQLVLNGAAYAGSASGALAIDVDFATATADLLTVGTASGATRLLIDPVGSSGPVIGSEILVVQAQAASDPGAFNLPGGTITQGLLSFGVVYKPTTFGYYLSTQANQSALALVGYPGALRNLWYKSADAWTRRLGGERDVPHAGDRGEGGFWLQPYGEVDHRDDIFAAPLSGQTAGFDLSHAQDYLGAQVGFDHVGRTARGTLKLGLTGGYLSSHINGRDTDDRLAADAWNVGLYGSWASGGFFANVLAKYDDYQGELTSLQSAFKVDVAGRAWGGMLELGYRFERDRHVFEPFANLGYVDTWFDSLAVQGVGAAFDVDASVRGRIGARAGVHTAASGFLYAGASYVREFQGDASAAIGTGPGLLLTQVRGEADYGEATFGVSVGGTGRATGFFEANARFGDTEGGGVRAGLKVTF